MPEDRLTKAVASAVQDRGRAIVQAVMAIIFHASGLERNGSLHQACATARWRRTADIGGSAASDYDRRMHPFPPALTLDAFHGDAVAQVWLDPHGVRFIFESEKQIYAETSVLHIEPNGTEWLFDCVGHEGAPVVLHRLLYKRIVIVKREELRLTLGMEDGSALVIASELSPYESGHIIMHAGDFTVF